MIYQFLEGVFTLEVLRGFKGLHRDEEKQETHAYKI